MIRNARRPGIPAYFHPAVAEAHWRALADAGQAVRAVVFNVDGGPGVVPELELTAVARRISVPLLGYVDCGFGDRPVDDVAADIVRYQAWYPTTGIFLDRVGSDRRHLTRCADVVTLARRHGATNVVLNHGVHPDPAYAAIADALVTFEGPATAYSLVTPPEWVHRWPAEKFWHLVYDTPAGEVDDVLRRADVNHVGTLYITDRTGANPWDGLPTYFHDRVAGAC